MSICKKGAATVAKCVNENAKVAVEEALTMNPWAQVTRYHPNAERLMDGAVQR